MRTTSLRTVTGALVGLGLLLAACGSDAASTGTTDTTIGAKKAIVVTSIEGDDSSALLAAFYARVLEDAGYRVSRKDPVTLDRAGYLKALEDGTIGLIPDWSNDLVAYLYDRPSASGSTVAPDTTAATGSTVPNTSGRSIEAQLVAIRSALPDGVQVGNPTSGERKQVIACSAAVMKANENNAFVNYTSLIPVAKTIRLAGPKAWMDDQQYGWPAFEALYGGGFKAVDTIEAADLPAALDADEVDCVAVDSMDPVITVKKLTVLEDDKALVRANAALPLLAGDIASEDVVNVLSQVNGALSSNKLNQMLNEIATNGTDPRTVANAFLDTTGSLTSTTLAG